MLNNFALIENVAFAVLCVKLSIVAYKAYVFLTFRVPIVNFVGSDTVTVWRVVCFRIVPTKNLISLFAV